MVKECLLHWLITILSCQFVFEDFEKVSDIISTGGLKRRSHYELNKGDSSNHLPQCCIP